jgi:hypothetical protein
MVIGRLGQMHREYEREKNKPDKTMSNEKIKETINAKYGKKGSEYRAGRPMKRKTR